MPNYNNIPTGLKIPSQIPLNVKEFVQDENTLKNLGPLNNLAFTYHKGLRVYCIAEKTIYEWNEVISGQENTGLLVTDFVYPNNVIAFGIDYSNKRYTFKKIIENTTIQNIGSGYGWFKELSNNVNKFKSLIVTTMGTGMSLFKDVQNNLNDLTIRLKSLKSNSVLISESNDTIYIELPQTNIALNSIYVNNNYHPNYEDFHIGNEWKGEGTSARPFTDTHVVLPNGTYTITPNTAIQNAWDYYLGSGTRLAPQYGYKTIVIEENNSFYTYSGDFNYNFSRVVINGYVKNTTSGHTIDMDNSLYFDVTNAFPVLEINGTLEITQGLGFRNSGNTVTSANPYTTGKALVIEGNGRIYGTYNGTSVLTRYLFNSEGNVNDSQGQFSIKCNVQALYQGVYFIKNKARIDFYNQVTSGQYLGTINYNLNAFHSTDGQIRFFENAAISISSELIPRKYGITFEPSGTVDSYSSFTGQGTRIQGACENLFVKLNDNYSALNVFNSISNYGANFANLFKNLGSTKWAVEFKSNTFSYSNINFDEVDLTMSNTTSSVNTIGGNIIECLVKYPYRDGIYGASTILGKNKAFINTDGSWDFNTPNSNWKRDITL